MYPSERLRGSRALVCCVLLAAACLSGCHRKRAISAEDGGRLRIGDAQLTVPPGALDDDTVILAEVRRPERNAVNGEILSLVYRFTPEGLVFDPPAQLDLLSRSGNAASVIAVWDAATGVLTPLPTTRSGNLLSADIAHFSDFVEADVEDDGGGGCSPACAGGTTCCEGVCQDLSSDEANCGACGTACGASSECCAGACIDVSADEANCGACGTTCGPCESCSAGTCESVCQPDEMCVNDECVADGNLCDGATVGPGAMVDFQINPQNCGGCDQPCPIHQTCEGGACTCPDGEPVCDSNCGFETCPGGECADTQFDPLNCGACGLACSGDQSEGCIFGGCCGAGSDACSPAGGSDDSCCTGRCGADGTCCSNVLNRCTAANDCCEGACSPEGFCCSLPGETCTPGFHMCCTGSCTPEGICSDAAGP